MNDVTDSTHPFFNRELSWLEFNDRVRGEASRPDTPLLERLKFLAISGSNLDEFFMVRVGGLLMQRRGKPEHTDIAGLIPDQQLELIRQRVRKMVADQYTCLNDELMPALEQHGICRLQVADLNATQLAHLQQHFSESLVAAVSPIAVRDQYDFPSMIGSALGLCLRVEGADLESIVNRLHDPADDDGLPRVRQRMVVVPIGRFLSRIIKVPVEQGMGFVLVEDVLACFADQLLPGHRILEAVPFRTGRNADVSVDEEGAADLLAGMQVMLEQRNSSECVRLEVHESASEETVRFLESCLNIGPELSWRIPGPLDLAAFFQLWGIPGFPELKFEPWVPQPASDYASGDDVFAWVAASDRVLVHPFQGFDPVVDFVRSAAADPRVLSIKQTLYRTSSDSEIVAALKTAAESGKHVTVILELKARFDEKRNIDWARQLERAGVDVVYGVRGLKTHAKICLVTRREPAGVRRYVHLGTGNYNESTARLYTDTSLLTCDELIGNDAVQLFNSITGLSAPLPMKRLVAAPLQLRSRFLELIDVETISARKGRPALIRAKMNSLVDREIIEHLYLASQAGVRIELNVRGICCLQPGVPGLSDNIRVVSIVDRLLEHSRIYYFLHGGDHLLYISSADWMGRNLDRRVELLVPVDDPRAGRRVINQLTTCLQDNLRSHQLQADGSWRPLQPEGNPALRSQYHLYQAAREEHLRETQNSPRMYHPHRASDAG